MVKASAVLARINDQSKQKALQPASCRNIDAQPASLNVR